MFFPKLILTDAGKALIVKALNGTAINFTKFALGDGVAPKEPRKLKALVHLMANMQINSIELSANCAVLESTYTNSGLRSKLVAREIGIFATDPDDGEILYAYANAGSEAAVVPPESGDMTVQETFHMVVTVGDATTVTATLGEYSGYASKADLQSHIDNKNNPHNVTAEQIGLGNVPNVTPANQQPVFSNDYITKPDGSYDVQNIASGEKMGNILRKIRTAIAAFTAHLSAKNPHNISAEDISAAAKNHKHSANDVTTGIFPVSRGGTGAATATEAREKLGVAAKEHKHSADDLTGVVKTSGSTMNGTATISWENSGNWPSNANVRFPVKRGGLHWAGQSDEVDLYAEETASDNLDLVIQFTDDESNGLSIRNTSGREVARIGANGTANFTKAYGAVYNDYAEFFPRGGETAPGDIIALDVNSKEERYVCADATCRMVAGVHSDEYAMLIGGESALAGEDYAEKNIKNYIPVALAGRVMTRVIGPVRTGDIIIPSEVPGVGRAATEGDVFSHWNIVGYAVEGDDRTDERKLRVRVGR